jgi:hypoxanthine phosphoribosyltransferase
MNKLHNKLGSISIVGFAIGGIIIGTITCPFLNIDQDLFINLLLLGLFLTILSISLFTWSRG